jgi:hypothetical protein
MGAFDNVENILIPNPEDAETFRARWHWEENESVLIKGTITVSDQEYVTNHYGNASKSGSIELKMGNGRFAILDKMIIDWTFVQNGQKVPVTPQNIRRLPANYSNPILEEIDKLTQRMTVVEQEDFLNSANEHTVDSLEIMRLSQKR